MSDTDRPDWYADAACADYPLTWWFPGKAGPKNGGMKRENFRAIEICRTSCLVQQECLDYALDNVIKEGIWGGEGDRSRRRLRVQRGITRSSGDNRHTSISEAV